MIPLELVVKELQVGHVIPQLRYVDGAIVADFEHPLPRAFVPEVIQIVVVPAGDYTITLPPDAGFVLQVRQHRIVIASGTGTFSFSVSVFIPFASPAWLQGSQRYTAGTLTPVANGTAFSFSFSAAPESVHALGVAFEAAGVLRLKLNGEALLRASGHGAATTRGEAVLSAAALQEKNEVTVELETRSQEQEMVCLQLVLFPLLSVSEVAPRDMEVTNSFNVRVRWEGDV